MRRISLGICLVLGLGDTGCRAESSEAGAKREEGAEKSAAEGADAPETGDGAGVGGATSAGAPAPGTRDEFLAALLALPDDSLRVVYEVEGPGGLSGTLEVLARSGGFRRENWTLVRVAPDGERRISGTTVQTPDKIWTGLDGEAGVSMPSPLGPLADAYLGLDAAQREQVLGSVDRWHRDLSEARARHPGEIKMVAGVECIRMRIAAQNLCLWERAGLPLEYAGAEFSLQATRVERGAKLGTAAFVPPEGASAAKSVPLPEAQQIDPKASVEALLAGEYADLTLVLTPGMRLPTFELGVD